jgi:acyl-CoA synthetase (AMP-forming)/AMP-acid ligase II
VVVPKALVTRWARTAALRFRDREALFCATTGRRFSYRQINDRCNRLANALAGLGLRKPATVAFLCNNRAELAETYYVLAKAGLTGIPLNYRLAPAKIVALMRAMSADAMLFSMRFASSAYDDRGRCRADPCSSHRILQNVVRLRTLQHGQAPRCSVKKRWTEQRDVILRLA